MERNWTINSSELKLWQKFFFDCGMCIKENETKVNEENFFEFLIKEKVISFYYDRCKNTLNSIEFIEKLKRYYFHFFGANEIYRRKVERIVGVLNRAGFTPLILKGIDLQENLYIKPELRPSSDLDIMILSRDDFYKVLNEIYRMNYQNYLYRSKAYPINFSKDIVLVSDDKKELMIELHHSLRFGPNDRRRNSDRIFFEGDNLILHNNGKISYYGFSAEANYVYLCYHAFKSHFNCHRLIWILDLLLLRNKLDENKLNIIAESSNMKETIDYGEKVLDFFLKDKKNNSFSFVKNSEPLRSQYYKLVDEFKNIEGLKSKLLWLMIWFFPDKIFLKKRYGENRWFFSLYIIYYTRLIAKLTRMLWNMANGT